MQLLSLPCLQIGRGPFAPSASGLVKIGELMTMVVGVEGPSGTDLLVRECVAHDGNFQDTYQLTDEVRPVEEQSNVSLSSSEVMKEKIYRLDGDEDNIQVVDRYQKPDDQIR